MKRMWVLAFVSVLFVSLLSCGKGQAESPQERAEGPEAVPRPTPARPQAGSDIITVFEDSIRAPAGMAFAADGALFVVSKRKVGQVYRIRVLEGRNTGAELFASRLEFYHPQYIAVDGGGFVYINRVYQERISGSRGTPSFDKPDPAGIFRISPDGRSFELIEDFSDDTLGLACEVEGNLLCCACPPHLMEESPGKFSDRVVGRYFGGSGGERPYIAKLEPEADSGLLHPHTVKGLESRPSDIVVDSSGNLFYAAGATVAKVDLGRFGGSSVFARLPVENPENVDSYGIGVDGEDNLYVACKAVYSPAGTVFKIDPAGNVTTFAVDITWPTDIVSDSDGNIYISDMKADKIFQVPAAARNLEGPFTVKKAVPPVKTVQEEPSVEEERHEEKIETSRPALTVEESPEISEIGEEPAAEERPSVEPEPSAEAESAFPDVVVLNTGKEMECEIIAETDDAVRIRTSVGTVSVMRDRVASLRYGTQPERGAKEHSKGEEGEFLSRAKEGDDAAVRQFLNEGMKPDVRDHNRRTPLMLAAFEGHDEVVAALLDGGADIGATDVDGWTALMYAVYGGRTTTARLLVEKGADVNAKVNSGQSVLMIAAQKGHVDAGRLLIERGAHVRTRDRDGRTALTWARREGHSEFAEMLEEAGAN